MGDVRDDVPLNAVRAALEAVDSGRVQIARDNLRILEIHLRAQLSARAAAPEGWRIGEIYERGTRHLFATEPDGTIWQASERSASFSGFVYRLLSAMLAAAPQPAGEDDPPRAFPPMPETPFSAPNGMQLFDSMHMHMYALTCVDAWAGPAPSAPSPGDALSLDGAAGRSAVVKDCLTTANVEALAQRLRGYAGAEDLLPQERADLYEAARRLSGAQQAGDGKDGGA